MNSFIPSFLLVSALVYAQADPHAQHQMHMPAPSETESHGDMNHGRLNPAEQYLMTMTSGTAVNPKSWPMPMLMPRIGTWNAMIMGQGFLIDTQQSGPRGRDKFYSSNWVMGSAVHQLGKGAVMFQTMFSLDPATITGRSYPLLFQTGETAFGRPLVDAQHPHDLFMGLGVHYARPIGENAMMQLYYAPVGDPALGPVAFPHRASALELPQASLSHHLQDSTHIASNVVTAALQYRRLKLEVSGFRGAEPDENRWVPDWGRMDSYSARLSVFPATNWMAQLSVGRLRSPELHIPDNMVRSTASVHYTRPTGLGNSWSTSVIWGQNHSATTGQFLNSYLVETLVPVSRRDFVTGRMEVVDKNELFADEHQNSGEAPHAERSYQIRAYTAGYTRDVPSPSFLQAGLGANVTFYSAPTELNSRYGEHPWGVSVFFRLRLRSLR